MKNEFETWSQKQGARNYIYQEKKPNHPTQVCTLTIIKLVQLQFTNFF